MQIKKKIKILFTALMLLSITLTACKSQEPSKDTLQLIKEKKQITVGVKFDSKPFGFIDQDQQLKGFDIDLAKEIAKRIVGNEESIEFKQVTPSNRIFSLTSGTLDMIAATMSINEKRKRIIDFSIPYHIAGQAIMVPKNSSIRNIKDLNGKRVVVVLGSTSERNIRELAPKAIIKGFRTYTDAYTALKAGRADAMTTDDTILIGFVLEDPNFKLLKGRYTKESYGIAFKKGEKSQTFQRAVNIAIEDIKADGTLQRLRNKWITKS